MDEAGSKWMERRMARLGKLKDKRAEETNELEKQLETEYEIDSDIMMKIKLAQDLVNYKELELQGYNKVQIANQKVVDYVKAVVANLEEGGLLVNEQSLLTAILAQNWQKVLEITQKHVIDEKELVNVAKMVNDTQYQGEQRLQNLITKRKDLYKDVMEKFVDASKEERSMMTTIITNLMSHTGGAFESAFRHLSKEQREMAVSMKDIFTPEQQQSMLKAQISLMDVGSRIMAQNIKSALEFQPEWDINLIKTNELWVDTIRVRNMAGETLGMDINKINASNAKVTPIAEKLDVNFGNIIVTLPEATKKELPELAGKKLTEILKKIIKTPPLRGAIEDITWEMTDKGRGEQ